MLSASRQNAGALVSRWGSVRGAETRPAMEQKPGTSGAGDQERTSGGGKPPGNGAKTRHARRGRQRTPKRGRRTPKRGRRTPKRGRGKPPDNGVKTLHARRGRQRTPKWGRRTPGDGAKTRHARRRSKNAQAVAREAAKKRKMTTHGEKRRGGSPVQGEKTRYT